MSLDKKPQPHCTGWYGRPIESAGYTASCISSGPSVHPRLTEEEMSLAWRMEAAQTSQGGCLRGPHAVEAGPRNVRSRRPQAAHPWLPKQSFHRHARDRFQIRGPPGLAKETACDRGHEASNKTCTRFCPSQAKPRSHRQVILGYLDRLLSPLSSTLHTHKSVALDWMQRSACPSAIYTVQVQKRAGGFKAFLP